MAEVQTWLCGTYCTIMWYILYNSDLKINKDKKCKKGEGLDVALHMVLTSTKTGQYFSYRKLIKLQHRLKVTTGSSFYSKTGPSVLIRTSLDNQCSLSQYQ